MEKRSNEPLSWSLFAAGGAMSGFFLPIHILLFGLLFPLGLLASPSYEGLLALFRFPLVRIYLFLLCSLTLFHWAHRFRYTISDWLQVKHLDALFVVLFYGSALVGTGFAAYLLVSLPGR
jgi:fumarate reductase subunit D